MKKNLFIIVALLLLFVSSCVQKAYKKTVVVMLTVPNGKNLKTVGIRGNGKPLSWDNDFEMKEVVKDSLYTAIVTTTTGYKFAEIKFTVNGEFELKEQPNRRVVFAATDTTFYSAVFDVPNK
jgi:hypothetical protein